MSVEWTFVRWHSDLDSVSSPWVPVWAFVRDHQPQGTWKLWSFLLPSVGDWISTNVLTQCRYGHTAAVYHQITGVWVILPSPTLLLSFCQFPSWHKVDKVWLGLISLVTHTHRSLAWPTGNYCSIIIDGSQRWGLITPAVTWCSVCSTLSFSFSNTVALFPSGFSYVLKHKCSCCVMYSYLQIYCTFHRNL